MLFVDCVNYYSYIVVHIPAGANPSCLQTTAASVASHISSHTVPHSLLKQISKRPSRSLGPSASRTSPSAQPGQ